MKSLINLLFLSEKNTDSKKVTKMEFPKPNSYWLNTRQDKIYEVLGMVCECADENDWKVLYTSVNKDDNWHLGQYRYRSLEEWHGNNRNGDPRFVKIPEYLLGIPKGVLLQALDDLEELIKSREGRFYYDELEQFIPLEFKFYDVIKACDIVEYADCRSHAEIVWKAYKKGQFFTDKNTLIKSF